MHPFSTTDDVDRAFDVLLLSDTASFDIQNIPQDGIFLRMMLSLRQSFAGSDDWAYMRFNNDSGNNYIDNVAYTLTTAFATSTGESAVSKARLPLTLGGGAPSSTDFTTLTIDIPCYSMTDRHKGYHGFGFTVGAKNTRLIPTFFGGSWDDNSAINRIQILTNAGGTNFKAGSRVTGWVFR